MLRNVVIYDNYLTWLFSWGYDLYKSLVNSLQALPTHESSCGIFCLPVSVIMPCGTITLRVRSLSEYIEYLGRCL